MNAVKQAQSLAKWAEGDYYKALAEAYVAAADAAETVDEADIAKGLARQEHRMRRSGRTVVQRSSKA